MKLEFYSGRSSCSGYTLSELIVTILIIGILASIAIPGFAKLLPDYRLRIAVQELYSNIHHAKMMAIKENRSIRVVFKTGENGSYRIVKPDGTVERTVSLNKDDASGNIFFGCGSATKGATVSGGTAPVDGVSYSYNKATFNSEGLGKSGYVYLCNRKGRAYAIGTWASGIIVLKKWNNSTNSWEM